MKFSDAFYVVTKAYARELAEKVTLFEANARTKKRIVLTLVAPEGLEKNTWSEDLIDRVVDGAALMA
jgi:hypothetical protein